MLGDVGVEAGEQGSDGMPRSARMVEPAKKERDALATQRPTRRKLESAPPVGSQETKGVPQPHHIAQPLGSGQDSTG